MGTNRVSWPLVTSKWQQVAAVAVVSKHDTVCLRPCNTKTVPPVVMLAARAEGAGRLGGSFLLHGTILGGTLLLYGTPRHRFSHESASMASQHQQPSLGITVLQQIECCQMALPPK